MFAKTIVDSDAFLDMPLSTQALYFHLSMRADDDGFLNNANKIRRTIGASEDDLKLLILKRFVLDFDDGIIVIKHWRMNNYLRSDRYKPTVYQEEKAMLDLKENGSYSLKNDVGIPNGYQRETQYSIGKDSIDKVSVDKDSLGNNTPLISPLGEEEVEKSKRTRFVPPTYEEVDAYCVERNNNVDAQAFIDFYESKGWMVGKNKMKDWKAAIRTWERSRQGNGNGKQTNQGTKWV